MEGKVATSAKQQMDLYNGIMMVNGESQLQSNNSLRNRSQLVAYIAG